MSGTGEIGVAGDVAPSDFSDEAALVRGLRARDERAYEHLVRTVGGRLLAVARRICASEADAEDAVQEAFVSALRAIDEFDGRAAVSTWLHRIVVNAALAKARRDRTRRERPIDDLMPRFTEGHHAESPRRWEDVTPGGGVPIEEAEAVRRALDTLPEEFRSVLVLRDIEGMESKAVAVALGISDALVRQRLHRGRLALMKLLEAQMARGGS
ncbi:MAG: sigma-70 family RNA polymerase sigma factor [Planctomycetota bacterium]|nr:sigma-70 family RNA polymerase sigma factor [Planctomycetota bacterium]